MDNQEAYAKFYDEINAYLPRFTNHQGEGIRALSAELEMIGILPKRLPLHTDTPTVWDFPKVNTVLDLGCGLGHDINWLSKEYKDSIEYFAGFDCRVWAKNPDELLFINEDLISRNFIQNKTLDMRRTLMLCLGNSVAEFEINQLFDIFKSTRPKYFVVEFCNNWEMDLLKFEKTKKNSIHHLPESAFYWYASFDEERPSVKWELRSSDGEDLLIINHPMISSRDLTLRLNSEYGYFVIHKYKRKCGWGEMNGLVFSCIDEDAKQLNDLFMNVIKNLISNCLKNDDVSAINNTLSDFESPMALCVLPFDSRYTFTRYIQMGENWPDPDNVFGNYRDMFLDKFNPHQNHYHTAIGIHSALLADISSSLIMQLSEESERFHEVDKAFKNLEDKFIKETLARWNPDGACEKSECRYAKNNLPYANNKQPDEVQKILSKSYFVVPIYYGSLPVIVFVCRFPSKTSLLNTDHKLLEAHLFNLKHIFKSYLSTERIEENIISPFLANVKHEDKINVDENVFKAKIIEHFKIACEKPWKSWVQTITSLPIKLLPSTKYENNKLIDTLIRITTRIYSDPFRFLSYEFKSVAFFDEDEHEKWNLDEHGKKLKQIYNKYKISSFKELKSCNNIPQVFQKIEGQNILDWLDRQINLLNGMQTAVPPTEEENLPFIKLKRTFQLDANGSSHFFRFCNERLCALLEISNISTELHTIKEDGSCIPIKFNVSMSFDPLPNFLKLVNNIRGISSIIHQRQEYEKGDLIRHTLSMRLKSAIHHVTTGRDYMTIREILYPEGCNLLPSLDKIQMDVEISKKNDIITYEGPKYSIYLNNQEVKPQ